MFRPEEGCMETSRTHAETRRSLKVLIIGGYGTFGGRLVDAPLDRAHLILWVAGRDEATARAFCRARLAKGGRARGREQLFRCSAGRCCVTCRGPCSRPPRWWPGSHLHPTRGGPERGARHRPLRRPAGHALLAFDGRGRWWPAHPINGGGRHRRAHASGPRTPAGRTLRARVPGA